MRIYYLAGVLLSVATILSACGESTPTECTISTTKDLKQGISKVGKFAPGTDCEAMRKLAEEGKPLPTIADASTQTAPKPAAATPTAPAFAAPLVSGKSTQDLIPTTDKKARVEELEKRMGISSQSPSDPFAKKTGDPKKTSVAIIETAIDSKQLRDPFTSTVINPVPKLETLLEKPKEPPKLRAAVVVRTSPKSKFVPPPPPDTKAAEGTKVTGTIEIAGTMYAIINAFDESSSRYVTAGQMISNGKVLVKRIDTNAEPPIVVLQQNGVEVLRPVVAAIDTTQPATTSPATSSTTQPMATPSDSARPFLLPSN